MGIQVEFNPDLALRNYKEYSKGSRKIEECIPQCMVRGEVYAFLKKGQRNYWLLGELPLLETNGYELSRPIASIKILEATHFLADSEIWTKGIYEIVDVFEQDSNEIHFEAYARKK
jgi:hypothetical protein